MDSKIKIHKFYQIHLLHTILFLSISRFCVGNDLIVLGNRNSLLNVFWYFLVADTELYIRGFVRPSICPSIGPSKEVIKSISGKMSVLDTFYVCLCMEWGFGCGWGLNAHAHPSATILWPRLTYLRDSWRVLKTLHANLVFGCPYQSALANYRKG